MEISIGIERSRQFIALQEYKRFSLLKVGFFIFVGFISLAPPLYLILPISSIVRSIRLYEVLFALILVMAFIKSTKEDKALFHKTPIDIPVLAIVFLWLVSMLNGSFLNQDINLRDYFALLKPIRLFLIMQMVIYFAEDRGDVKKIIYILIIFSLYPEVLGILEYLNYLSIKKFLSTVYVGYEYSSNIVGGFDVYGVGFLHKFRASSVFVGDVNAFGGYAALFFIMALLYCVYVPSTKDKIIFALICCVSLYGVLISGSRKAIFCVVLGVLIFFVVKFKRFLKALPVYVLCSLVIVKLTPAYIGQRLFEHWDYKIRNILNLWLKYLDLDITALLMGNGAVHKFGIDSFYLKLLLRGGILGLIAHLVLIFVVLKISIYVLKNARCWLDEMVGLMAIALTISIEWLNVTGLYFYCGRVSESYWIVLGTLFVVYKFIKSEKIALYAGKDLPGVRS